MASGDGEDQGDFSVQEQLRLCYSTLQRIASNLSSTTQSGTATVSSSAPTFTSALTSPATVTAPATMISTNTQSAAGSIRKLTMYKLEIHNY